MTRQQLRAQLRADAFVRVNAAYGPEPRAARRKIARAWAKTEWRKRAAQLVVSCGIAALTSLGILATAQPARAQGSRKDDIVLDAQGHPMAGATVRVCTASATGQPCTPLANIYSDPAMTQAMANPLTSDGLGNYTFYAAPGRYEIEIDGPNITTKQMPNVILPNDPSTPTFTTLTTTSGISAFSLSLSGNLTVNGSTAVTGTLTEGGAPVATTTPTFVTTNAESTLPNSRQLVNGTGTTINTTVPGEISINASGAAGALVDSLSARSSAPFGTTCTISGSSMAMTLGAASNFQNGDYVACYGAGATNSMTTPSAPTISPAIAKGLLGSGVVVGESGQSTSYSYKIIAFDQHGGYTAASSAGSTSSGDATLGLHTVSVSSVSKSGTTATFTLASSVSSLAVGTLVHVTGMNNAPDMAGWYLISAVNSGTSVSMIQTDSTAYPGATASDSGEGSMAWYIGNYISWTPVSGGWFYCAYETVPASRFVGCSRPDGTVNEDYITDFGATIMGNVTTPAWIPTSPPSSASNDVLVTQITAGGGTTSVTVGTAASNAVTAGPALFDESVPLYNAALAANNAGTPLYIPPMSLVIGAPFVSMPSSVTVRSAGVIYFEGTLELNGASHWIGLIDNGTNGLTPASSWAVGPPMYGYGCVPSIYLQGMEQGGLIQGMQFQADNGSNQVLFMLGDGVQHTQFSNNAFSTGTNTNDTMGISLVLRSPLDTFQNSFDHNLFSGAELVQDSTWAPEVLAQGLSGQGVGNVEFDETLFYTRGIYWNSPGPTVVSHFSHIQAPITPLFSTSAGYGTVEFDQAIIDSAVEPVVANLSGSIFGGSVALHGTTTSNFAALNGAPFELVYNGGFNGWVGQNFNFSEELEVIS